jgi:hypothetical protein
LGVSRKQLHSYTEGTKSMEVARANALASLPNAELKAGAQV